VIGDGRTYDHAVGLRAATSTDGMTAGLLSALHVVFGATATRIINEVKSVNRAVHDVTSRPPGTIDLE
jgi:GMP synthase (glutamine-hydrolysing)